MPPKPNTCDCGKDALGIRTDSTTFTHETSLDFIKCRRLKNNDAEEDLFLLQVEEGRNRCPRGLLRRLVLYLRLAA